MEITFRAICARVSSPPGGAAPAPIEPEADERLARRAAAGDRCAFEEIFYRYQQDLYRFCVGILREPHDAQDAVQNTMVKALRALPGETREMQLKPWLYRIAHNEAVELRRRRRPVESLDATVDVAGVPTEEQVELEARLQTLLADIADLPERQRSALVMRELSGLEFDEIAAALGTSSGAARQMLYEARRGLSQMESGRELDCDLAMRQVSDADGSPSQRGIRAHLRDCFRCRRFQTEIRGRRQTLAAISPLPVVLAANLWKGAFGGTSTGAAGVAAGAGGLSTGGVGALGVSGLVKAAAGLVATIAIGTVAIDHGIPRGQGAESVPGGGRPAAMRSVESPALGVTATASTSITGSRRTEAAVPAVGDRVATRAHRAEIPVAREQTALPPVPEQAAASPRGASALLPAGVGEETQIRAETTSGGAGANAEGGDPKVEKQEAQAEAKEQRAEAKSEAKAEKSEAKAEAKVEKAESKAEKVEAKSEAKVEKGEAKAAKAETKAESSEARQEPAPAEAPVAEQPPTEAPEDPVEAAPGKSGQSHGKSAKGETAPTE